MKTNQNAESQSHALVRCCPIYYNKFYCNINLTGSIKQAFAIDWLRDQKVDTNERSNEEKMKAKENTQFLFLILFPQ